MEADQEALEAVHELHTRWSKGIGFDVPITKNLKPINTTRTPDGGVKITFEFKVVPEVLNGNGKMHGGAVATLVDEVSFYPLHILDPNIRVVSRNISTFYIRPIDVDDVLTVVATSLSIGRRSAAIKIEIFNEQNKLVAVGTQDVSAVGSKM